MEKQKFIVIDLADVEQLASLMAQALPELDCPDCCGPTYEFIEFGAGVYQEEWEWACFSTAVIHTRTKRRSP
jgi:hypothetical protein